MCELKFDQELSAKVFAVGHKVVFQGKTATITGIRVWHETHETRQGVEPVFDLRYDGGFYTNARLDDIEVLR